MTVADVGRYDFTDVGISGADELSGLIYAGGNTYYAISDGQAKLFTMTIDLNPVTGAVTSASIGGSPLQLNDAGGSPLAGSDREGVALAGTGVWIANENGPELSRHSLTTGNRLQQITTASNAQLGVFNNAVGNRSWESLSRRSDGSQTWTANEEALTVDGALATNSAGMSGASSCSGRGGPSCTRCHTA